MAFGYEEVSPGQAWTSPARTVTEGMITSFAGLTGDFNPIHVDHVHAANTPFGRPIAHGLLGLSLASGLASACPAMKTLAFLRIVGWEFGTPIYIGDTVHLEAELLAVEPSGNGRRATLRWRRRLINQKGETCQEGVTETLVSR